ncbi:MAG: septum formation initiator family protein [Desulfonauticus sp.]|nr:septum formation initiator family protein [Desulfonauticus sp.]
MKKIFIFCLLVINLFLVYKIIFSKFNYKIYFDLKNKLAQDRLKIISLKQENAKISKQILDLRNNKQYIKFVIRKKLNYIKPGEMLYLLKR